MFPMTPMGWTLLTLRASAQVMTLNMRVARAIADAGRQSAYALSPMRAGLPGAAMGICGPVSLRPKSQVRPASNDDKPV